MDIKLLFGQRIKTLRKKRNWTQLQVAEMVNVDAKHISCVENGKNFPSPELIAKLAEAFKLHPSELFEFENTPTTTDLKQDLVKLIESANNNEIAKIYIYTKFITG